MDHEWGFGPILFRVRFLLPSNVINNQKTCYMKKKYVNDFNGFVNENLEDETINGSDEPKPELRGGQKAAITRGDDILSDEQYAACYLNAVQALGRGEDTHGRGDTGLTRNALKMSNEGPEDWQSISGAKLSAYLNLKPQTVERTVSKFKLLLQGQRDGTPSNVIWPELVNIFDRFELMQKGEVLAMAEEAINSEPDMTAYQEYLDKMAEQSKKSRNKQKDTDERVRKQVRKTFLDLASQFNGDLEKAVKFTTKALAQSYNTSAEDIEAQARIEFKKEPSIIKAWTKKRFV